MTLRIERDPEFWCSIAAHPDVGPRVLHGLPPESLGALVVHASVTPLAGINGGFLLRNLDGLGFVNELHSLFLPGAWGREVTEASWEMYAIAFKQGQILITSQQRDWWRSAPPRSHGWRSAVDYRATPLGELRIWILTPDALEASPAAIRRRGKCQ